MKINPNISLIYPYIKNSKITSKKSSDIIRNEFKIDVNPELEEGSENRVNNKKGEFISLRSKDEFSGIYEKSKLKNQTIPGQYFDRRG